MNTFKMGRKTQLVIFLAIIALVVVGARSYLAAAGDRGSLIDAIAKGDVARVKELLDQGADPDAKDAASMLRRARAAYAGYMKNDHETIEHGRSALGWAAEYGDATIVRLLLDHHANPSVWDHSGRTPLHWAAGSGSTEVIEQLLDKGVDINIRSRGNLPGRTPLSEAAEDGRTEAVRLLVARGADVNAQDRIGKTPLIWAARWGNVETIKILLKSGANRSVKNTSGLTAHQSAVAQGRKDLAALLR